MIQGEEQCLWLRQRSAREKVPGHGTLLPSWTDQGCPFSQARWCPPAKPNEYCSGAGELMVRMWQGEDEKRLLWCNFREMEQVKCNWGPESLF